MLSSLAAYLHDIDPYLIQLWEGGPIRWYGMSYVVGVLLGCWLISLVVKRGKTPLSNGNDIQVVATALGIGMVVGGRLGYVLFYDISLLGFDKAFPYWQVLAFHRGGMASHGGMIGLGVACLYLARVYQVDWRHFGDLACFAGPAGVFFGRIANFINGELIGRPCAPTFPLAVKFPQEMRDWNAGVDADAERMTHLWQGLSQVKNVPSDLLDIRAHYQRVHWAIQEIQAGNEAVAEVVRPLLLPRHPSQLYAAVLEGAVVFGIMLWVYQRPRSPGVLSGICLCSYAVVRVINEFFRRPDVHLLDAEFALTGVSRGQWLSLGLLAAGIALWVWSHRSSGPALGGWRTGKPTAA